MQQAGADSGGWHGRGDKTGVRRRRRIGKGRREERRRRRRKGRFAGSRECAAAKEPCEGRGRSLPAASGAGVEDGRGDSVAGAGPAVPGIPTGRL